LFPTLSAKRERHIIEFGVTDFVVRRDRHFDGMTVRTVKAAKERHPEVTLTLTLLLPYPPFNWPILTPPAFDGTFYPPGMETVPKRVAIVRVNRYMVDHSDYLIAYAWHPASNARDLAEYAQRHEKQGFIKITTLSNL